MDLMKNNCLTWFYNVTDIELILKKVTIEQYIQVIIKMITDILYYIYQLIFNCFFNILIQTKIN